MNFLSVVTQCALAFDILALFFLSGACGPAATHSANK
jgi:hypothetical protein